MARRPKTTRGRRVKKGRTKKTQKCLLDDKFKRSEDNIVKAKMVTLGQPLAKDREVTNVSGIGRSYDGNWYIRSAKAKIGKGYKTHYKLARNTSGKSPSVTQKKAEAGSKVNNGIKGNRPGTSKKITFLKNKTENRAR